MSTHSEDEQVLVCVVEIPKGSRSKYEYDPELGGIKFDRLLMSAATYPADYGYLRGTLGQDGDPGRPRVPVRADVPRLPDTRQARRHVHDERREGHRRQDHLRSPPRSLLESYEELEDLPLLLRQEIEQFFSIYKDLEGKAVAIEGGAPARRRSARSRPLSREPWTPLAAISAATAPSVTFAHARAGACGAADRARHGRRSRSTAVRGQSDAPARFVVHEHHARRLHWDLRLEHDGALMSWAVPNGIPQDPRENRKAIHVEDHPLSYIDFEGEIPAGQLRSRSRRDLGQRQLRAARSSRTASSSSSSTASACAGATPCFAPAASGTG